MLTTLLAVAPEQGPTELVIGLGIFCALVLAWALRPAWMLALGLRLFWLAVVILKWLFVAGLLTGFTCSPQFFCAVGWTPMSLLFGDGIYAHALRSRDYGCQLPHTWRNP